MRKYTKEFLEPLVKNNISITGILRELGLKITGGNHRGISQRIKEYKLDTSHFCGTNWAKGKTKENDIRIKNIAIKKSIPLEEIFKENSGYSSSKLYKILLSLGWVEKCNICGINEWLGKKLRLHVDHINGNHTDNRFENLRFLCPNCHQLTDTWGNKRNANKRECDGMVDIPHLECGASNSVRVRVSSFPLCIDCGVDISKGCSRCKSCSSIYYHRDKTKRPTKKELGETLLRFNNNKMAVARFYGVSDNAVRKWIKFYEKAS